MAIGPTETTKLSVPGNDTELKDTRNATSTPAATPSEAGALPYPLRQAVQRYPVTLYTSDKCNPCNSARELLQKRGVPFTEKTITTAEDGQAFAALAKAVR